MTLTPVAGKLATVRPWAATVVRLGLAAVWIWAGVSKIGDPDESLRAVRAYDVLPEWLAKAVAYGLPFVEIALAVLLLAGLVTRFAAIVSGVLLAVFIAGIASAWARGLTIDCGCFGGGGEVNSNDTRYPLEILRDAGLLLLSAALALWPASRFSADEVIERSGAAPQSAVRVGRKNTKDAQRRLRELQARRHAEGRRRLRVIAAVAAVALAVVGAIGIGVQSNRAGPTGPVDAPRIAVGDNGRDGLAFGPPDSTVVVDVYQDFQCPVCKAFHLKTGSALIQLYKTGKVQVRYHTVAFLNRFSSTDYSSRSAAAGGCAADADIFEPFQDSLFQAQPPEGGEGLSQAQMEEIGRTDGASGTEFFDCIRDGTYDDWVEVVTDSASRDGHNSVPTILVNGEQVRDSDGSPPGPDALNRAVQNAGA